MNRQTERRLQFRQLLSTMPMWEVWREERPAPTEDDPEKTRTVGHCKLIPRSVRRDMARQRMKREWKLMKGVVKRTTPSSSP